MCFYPSIEEKNPYKICDKDGLGKHTKSTQMYITLEHHESEKRLIQNDLNKSLFQLIVIRPIKNSFYTKRSLFLVFTASKILFHTKQHTRKCGYAHTNNHIIHMSVSGRMPTLACLQAAIHALSTQFTFIQSAY